MNRQTGLHVVLLFAGVSLLSGCAPSGDRELQARAASMDACEKIDAAVSAWESDFVAIRGRQTSTRLANVWNSSVVAAGDSCQVWNRAEDWHYVCTSAAPNEAVARQWFEKTRQTIDTCLSDWNDERLARRNDAGERVVWSRPGHPPVVSVHVFPSPGVFSDQWSVYTFVGNRNDSL